MPPPLSAVGSLVAERDDDTPDDAAPDTPEASPVEPTEAVREPHPRWGLVSPYIAPGLPEPGEVVEPGPRIIGAPTRLVMRDFDSERFIVRYVDAEGVVHSVPEQRLPPGEHSEASDPLIASIRGGQGVLRTARGEIPEHVDYTVSSEFGGESSVTIKAPGYPDLTIEVEVQGRDWEVDLDDRGCSVRRSGSARQSSCEPPTLELARVAARVSEEPVDETRWEPMTREDARGYAMIFSEECQAWRHRESIYVRQIVCPWDEIGRSEWRRRQREAR